MAFLFRRGSLKGFSTVLKCELTSVCDVCLSSFSMGVDQLDRYQPQMWRRLKKHDPEMDHFLNYKPTVERIKDLSRLMECSIAEASEFVKRDSPLGVTDFDKLQKVIQLLKSHKYSTRDIIANPAVLHRSYEVLKHRLATLKEIKCPANSFSLSVLKRNNKDFKIFVEKHLQEDEFYSLYSSQQNGLAVVLECDNARVKQLIDEHELTSVSPVLLKNKIEVMKQFQIPTNVIQNTMKALVNTSLTNIEKRLQLLKNENLLESLNITLGYLLLCKEKDFQNSFTILKSNHRALDFCNNKEEYLIFRLKCSEKVAGSLVEKRPICSMSNVKLKKMLDFFLYEMKVSSDFVISNVHLMGYSVERMQKRWCVICSSGYENTKQLVQLLGMSNKKFEKAKEKIDGVNR